MILATFALYGRAGPVTFCNRAKSNQKRLPLHPASSSGARNGRDASTAHESSADATHSVCRRRIYDRPLLRSSARAEGAVERIFDRFAMKIARTRMRASGLRHLWLVKNTKRKVGKLVVAEIYWVADVQPLRLGLMARPRAGEWLVDEIAAWRAAKVRLAVSLLESHEIRELDLSSERQLCETNGIEFVSFPIRDRGVPESLHATVTLVDSLVSRLQGGQAVAIHCRAGIGRTGLIAGCVLSKLGIPSTTIFRVLSKARGLTVPDTQEQIEWLPKFERVSRAP